MHSRLKPLRTLESNHAEHKIDIPWINLPPTFQDAIVFAQWYGIRYLWIDRYVDNLAQSSTAAWAFAFRNGPSVAEGLVFHAKLLSFERELAGADELGPLTPFSGGH